MSSSHLLNSNDRSVIVRVFCPHCLNCNVGVTLVHFDSQSKPLFLSCYHANHSLWLDALDQYTLLLFAQACTGDHMRGNATCSSSLPRRMLTHISMICSNVGIIDPEQLLQWALSFFFSSVSLGRAWQRLPSVSKPRTCTAESRRRHLANEVLLSISGDSVAICFHYFDKPF